jgi:hypothetical protein
VKALGGYRQPKNDGFGEEAQLVAQWRVRAIDTEFTVAFNAIVLLCIFAVV